MCEKANVKGIKISSCGLGSWHQGQLPEIRMREAALKRGFSLDSHAEKITRRHFHQYEMILAADASVLHSLREMTESEQERSRLFLMGDFGITYRGQEIPDPYHGTEEDFELALDMIEDACSGLLAHLLADPSSV